MKYAVLAVLVLGLGLMGWRLLGPAGEGPEARAAEIVVPELSAPAKFGKKGFDDNCAECHGQSLAGTDKGPPLIHDFYNPGHHSDAAFYAAVAKGVRQHHWRFGDMKPLPQVSEDEVRMIIRYVREMQRANGITYRPH